MVILSYLVMLKLLFAQVALPTPDGVAGTGVDQTAIAKATVTTAKISIFRYGCNMIAEVMIPKLMYSHGIS